MSLGFSPRSEKRALALSRRLAALLLLWATAAEGATFIVCLDPGHGGVHDGAQSPSHVEEKTVALAVAQDVEKRLEKSGIEVVMTRTADRDVPLRRRTEIANEAHADLFVSIHCNSMPTLRARRITRGIETYFLSADASDPEANAIAARENADSGEPADARPSSGTIALILQDLARDQAHRDSSLLAEDIHRTLVRALHARNRGVRQAPFLVLLGAQMPAVLVEIGFISNPVEGKLLARAAYQKRVAAALTQAILTYRKTVYARRIARSSAAVPEGRKTALAVPSAEKTR